MILHFLLLGLAAFGTGAHATSFYIRPLPEFTRDAENIVRGRLHRPRSEFAVSSSGERNIYTFAELEVREVLKGDLGRTQWVIRKLGGTKDGVTLHIPGSPEFRDNEEAVFFLGPEKEDHSFEVSGLELGKFGLEEKNGELALTGGLLSFSTGPEARGAIGPGVTENQRTWTLKQLKSLIETQGNGAQSRVATPKNPVPLPSLSPGQTQDLLINSKSSPPPERAFKERAPEGSPLRLRAAGILFMVVGALLGIFLYLRRK